MALYIRLNRKICDGEFRGVAVAANRYLMKPASREILEFELPPMVTDSWRVAVRRPLLTATRI